MAGNGQIHWNQFNSMISNFIYSNLKYLLNTKKIIKEEWQLISMEPKLQSNSKTVAVWGLQENILSDDNQHQSQKSGVQYYNNSHKN